MNISFTGIKNLEIKTFKAQGYGLYLNNANEITEGDKYYTLVSLKADLDTTPLKGENTQNKDYLPHLHHYLNALQKLKQIDRFEKILNMNNPKGIEIIMKHFYAPDELGDVNQALFTLNGEDIPLTHRNELPLYTFMARLTRDALKFFDISKARESVQLMNDSISKKAEEFIENMNL